MTTPSPLPTRGKEDFAVYREVISQVIQGQERLPSLPAITIKLRSATQDPTISNAKLAQLIMRDPSLSALILKTANCSLYRRAASAKTLSDAINLLGRDQIGQLIMMHSVSSLFVMKSPALKKLFVLGWQRLAQKTGVCVLLTGLTGFKPAYLPVTACFLSELGTLAILSAFADQPVIPTQDSYIQLCREYSKQLSIILLKKWHLDNEFVDLIRQTGQWRTPPAPALSEMEIVNLSLYHVLAMFQGVTDLPPLLTVPAYRNLPPELKSLDDNGLLSKVTERVTAIENFAGLL